MAGKDTIDIKTLTKKQFQSMPEGSVVVVPIQFVPDTHQYNYDKSVAELQSKYDALLQTLRKNGILFHFVDETILEQHGSVENGILKVGRCVYDKLIIPDMVSVSAQTCRLLEQYSGKLLQMGELDSALDIFHPKNLKTYIKTLSADGALRRLLSEEFQECRE